MKALKTLGQTLALSALAIGTTTGSVEARGQSTLKKVELSRIERHSSIGVAFLKRNSYF